MSWSAIVAPAGTSKSEAAWRVARALSSRGVRVGGFLQREIRAEDGVVIGWDVEHVPSGERCRLARSSARPEMCSYEFDEAGFARAAEWLGELEARVVLAGGIGKLEAAGGGHFPGVIAALRAGDGRHVVMCVRLDCLSAIALSLPEDPVGWLELPAAEEDLNAFVDAVASAAAARPLPAGEPGASPREDVRGS